MNILLVEDDPIDRKLLAAVLKSSGHRVLEKSTAEQAAKEIKHRQPEVVVLDLKLPGIDGLELARRLRADADTRHIRIVAITAARESYSQDAALAAGCDAFIVKPVDTRTLSDQIVNVVIAQPHQPEPE